MQQQVTWRVVLRLAVVVTAVAGLVVVGGGSALWLAEANHPGTTIHSWEDAWWLALTTMTTVGYGDHVPVTATGRVIAAAVMIAGVAVIGAVAAVAAVVALAVGRRMAVQEERGLEAEAGRLEGRLEQRLARIEEHLAALDARLRVWPPEPAEQPVEGRSGPV